MSTTWNVVMNLNIVTGNAIQTLKSISLVFYYFIFRVLLLQVMLYKHWSLRIVLRLYRSEEQLLKLQLLREEVLGQKQVKQIFLCVIFIFIAPDSNGHVIFCHYLVFLFVHYKLVQVLADTTGPIWTLHGNSFLHIKKIHSQMILQ